MKKKVGVLLSGCGVFDGAEIHEAVLTLLFLDQAGADVLCMAPDMDQAHVIDHLTQQEMDQTRNARVESARIARGHVENVQNVSAADLDALIIPGGFGAAKNLSDFAFKGPDATVFAPVQRLIEEMIAAQKPIGALCIAPATLTRAIGAKHPRVTIGQDAATAAGIETMGGRHQLTAVDDICVDPDLKLVTTPAYMLGPGIKDVAVGIEKLVKTVMEMID